MEDLQVYFFLLYVNPTNSANNKILKKDVFRLVISRGQSNIPHSLWSLCGSVVEHQSVESEGLRFASSRGLRIFS